MIRAALLTRAEPFGAAFHQIVGRVSAAREVTFCAQRYELFALRTGIRVIPASRAEMLAPARIGD